MNQVEAGCSESQWPLPRYTTARLTPEVLPSRGCHGTRRTLSRHLGNEPSGSSSNPWTARRRGSGHLLCLERYHHAGDGDGWFPPSSPYSPGPASPERLKAAARARGDCRGTRQVRQTLEVLLSRGCHGSRGPPSSPPRR
ncbi:uncharacterized protein LOC144100304 isoform X2 [Amblyomma americanum]